MNGTMNCRIHESFFFLHGRYRSYWYINGAAFFNILYVVLVISLKNSSNQMLKSNSHTEWSGAYTSLYPKH